MSMQNPYCLRCAQFWLFLAKTKEQNPFLPSFSISNQTELTKNTDTSPISSSEKMNVPYFSYFSNQTFKNQDSKHPDKTSMQYECTQLLLSFQIKNYLSPKDFEGMVRRTWHSYAYGLHLHFSVQLKSLLKSVVFLRRKSRTPQRSCGFLVGSVRLDFKQPGPA